MKAKGAGVGTQDAIDRSERQRCRVIAVALPTAGGTPFGQNTTATMKTGAASRFVTAAAPVHRVSAPRSRVIVPLPFFLSRRKSISINLSDMWKETRCVRAWSKHLRFLLISLFLLAPAFAFAAELVTLSPENYAAYAPKGMQAWAFFGDYVLRNEVLRWR